MLVITRYFYGLRVAYKGKAIYVGIIYINLTDINLIDIA